VNELPPLATFPTPPDVQDVADALSGMVARGEVERCIVLYERPDGNYGWLTTPFQRKTDQLGFVELVKLDMYHDFAHDEGGDSA